MSEFFRPMLKAALGLGIFAVLTAGAIALTQNLTADRIAQQIRLAQSAALLEILPANTHDNQLLDTTLTLPATPELGLRDGGTVFLAEQQGQVSAVILPVTAPEGYSGPIRLIVGVDRDGIIKGVRVLEHRETPGLGDQIELRKSNWVQGFDGKSLASPKDEQWKVAKDGGAFDQFTGATITPRAIVRAVHQSLQYFDAHRPQLLRENGATPSTTPPITPHATPQATATPTEPVPHG